MIWVWIVLAVLVVAGGALVPVLAGRNRRADGGGAEIAARERYELLGHYVADPPVTDDPEAAALLRQARERWNSTGALLATARTNPDFQQAEQTARQGLAHLTQAHTKLNLPHP